MGGAGEILAGPLERSQRRGADGEQALARKLATAGASMHD